MAHVTYVPNPLFHEEIERQAEFKAGRYRIAKEAARLVRAFAPVHTGYYKRHIRAVLTGVRAEDSYWHWIEFGSVNNKPSAPLRRGFRAAGLRLVVHPKPSQRFIAGKRPS